MGISSMDYLYVCYFLAIGLFIGTIILELITVIPLQMREAGVKNGLRKLRKQLLTKGILTIGIALGCVISLTSRFFISDPELNRYIIATTIFGIAGFLFYKSFVDNRIYNQEYTPENKEYHAELAKMEEKLAKKRK